MMELEDDQIYEECDGCGGAGMDVEEFTDALWVCSKCGGSGYVEHECDNDELD